MALSPTEQEALDRLDDYNANRNTVDNPRGMGGEGYKTEIPRATNDMATAARAVARETSAAAQSAASAGAARDIALGAVVAVNAANDLALTYTNESRDARDEAVTARNTAASYAAGLHLPALAPADAGKTLKVKPDGSGYELASSGVSLAQLHALAFS